MHFENMLTSQNRDRDRRRQIPSKTAAAKNREKENRICLEQSINSRQTDKQLGNMTDTQTKPKRHGLTDRQQT